MESQPTNSNVMKIFVERCTNSSGYKRHPVVYYEELIHAELSDMIDLVPTRTQADLVICTDSTYLAQDCSLDDHGLLVFETMDASTILEREIVRRENVKAVVRGQNLTNMELNNHWMIESRYHVNLLGALYDYNRERTPEGIPDPILSKDDLGKVWTLYPHISRFEHMVRDGRRDFLSRDLDIAYFGTNKYEIELITQHRNSAVEAVRRLGCRNYSIATSETRISRREFGSLLERTKTFLSPYGYGEWSHKDYQAIISGCLLIKPQCDFFESYPNIYRDGETCIQCKADFSDLESKLAFAHSHPQLCMEIIQSGQKLLKRYLDRSLVARDFWLMLEASV